MIQETVQRVGWILGELPEDERAGTTVEQWLQSIHQESGLTYDRALRSEVEAPKIMGEIETIVQMLEGNGPLFYGSAGLPIGNAISRRKAKMEEQAEVRRQRQLLEASRLRHSRRSVLDGNLLFRNLPYFMKIERRPTRRCLRGHACGRAE
ncbi:hypothetical protein [Mesorhizobium sp. M0019]|uniref:hypothetical protein n=1 Tax=Mesorhizobium sp. M0019 TaxID=2956845 RepID=UPI00333892A2